MGGIIVPLFSETAGWTVTIDGRTYRPALIDSAGHLQVDVLTSALPTGAATSAKQDTMITALQLIDDLRNALGTVATDDLRVRLLLASISPFPTVVNGRSTVTTAGTRVQLPSAAGVAVSVKALPGNTNNIYLGDSAVSSANGHVLDAGDVVNLAIDNLNRLYIDADTNGDNLSYLAVA